MLQLSVVLSFGLTCPFLHAPDSPVRQSAAPCFRVQGVDVEEKLQNSAAERLEISRVRTVRKWFSGAEQQRRLLARDWQDNPCIVVLKNLPDLRKSPPGFTNITRDTGAERRVIKRVIFLNLEAPEALTSVLPHEITHAVLSDALGRYDVPRWADEGMAVLSESLQNQWRHLTLLDPRRERQAEFLPLDRLVQLKDYPSNKHLPLFYAQSASLVHFLCERKTSQDFLPFLRAVQTAEKKTWEELLHKHYDIASFARLEQLWREHCRTYFLPQPLRVTP